MAEIPYENMRMGYLYSLVKSTHELKECKLRSSTVVDFE